MLTFPLMPTLQETVAERERAIRWWRRHPRITRYLLRRRGVRSALRREGGGWS